MRGAESLVKHRTRNPGKEDHKVAQLCAQIEQVISFALGDAADVRLHDLIVHSVVPSPDGGRLLVGVVATRPLDGHSLEDMQRALDSARPWLRRQVAAEIHRKRTPDLAFQILPPWEDA
jgi:ribosome-binding factor A